MPSTAAAHFKQALQSPAYAEAYHRSQDRAHGFTRVTGSASARECKADEGQSNCPDPDSQFHSRRFGEIDFILETAGQSLSYPNSGCGLCAGRTKLGRAARDCFVLSGAFKFCLPLGENFLGQVLLARKRGVFRLRSAVASLRSR